MTHFINKAIIQGNLGSDPITKPSKKGSNFVIFSIATEVEYTTEGLVANIPSNTKNYYSLISRHNSPYKYQTAYLQN